MTDLFNSRILITGGAGFIGSTTADLLIKEGVSEIIIIDNLIRGSIENLQDALNSGKIKFVEGDIRDQVLIDSLMKGVDYCFHMAALRITQCAAEPRHALEIMFDSAFNIFELCVKYKIKRLVAASSASIYGTADSFPTLESHHPYNNHTLYGAGKVANELMLRSFHDMYGLDYAAMRYFNVYGPRMDVHGKYTEVLIRWYNLIKEGKPPLIFGDGKQTMDFIYIEDIARANVLALKSDSKDMAFNIASGVETSLEELCFTLLEVMGSGLKPEYIPLPEERKKVEVGRRLASTTLAERHIGFKFQMTLKEGLYKLVDWLDKQFK
ncbi:MAG: NAD-dependent epimerase/dehydratase family protein [Nitrospirae bacterium]|nr:NAD-dependent epimerase/dehydratase family protein [Nitrospirota bacterium]